MSTSVCGATSQRANERWYALYTKSHQEKLVKEILESRNIEVFLPIIRSSPRQRSVHLCERPFFPRYLFGRLDLQRVPLSSINWTPGVASVVSFDGQPATVPDGVVDWLRASLGAWGTSDHFDGLPLQPGDLMHIKAGPLKGMEAIFDRQLTAEGRARVLVQMLGRLATCEVELGCLIRA